MRLAANETRLKIDDKIVVTLRPSLRAAYRLLAAEDAFATLIRAILDFELGTITRIVGESATDADEAEAFLEGVFYSPLGRNQQRITEGLLHHVQALVGLDHNQDAKNVTPDDSDSVPFAEYFETLYRLATGWLDWPPETAWNATPAEILEAHKGKLEMLKAIYGSSETKASEYEPHWERDEDAFAELKASHPKKS